MFASRLCVAATCCGLVVLAACWPAGAPAATPASKRSALAVGSSATFPATVTGGTLLTVRVSITNRGGRDAGTTRAAVSLVNGRREKRLAQVVVPAIAEGRTLQPRLKVPVPPAGVTGVWRVRVCVDVRRAMGPGRRGACRTFKKEITVRAKPAPTAAASVPAAGPVVAAAGSAGAAPSAPGSAPGGTVVTPAPVLPTPPAPPAPRWKLEMTPDPLVLGAIPAGADGDESTLSERPFTITNTGTEPSPDFYVGNYGFRDGGVIASTFLDVGALGRCGVLAPGASCSGELRWDVGGVGTGDLRGELRLFRPAASGPLAFENFQSFPFSADYVSRVWFGATDVTVTVNETSRQFELAVYNSGDIAGGVAIAPEFPAPSPSGTCAGIALAPETSCTLIRKGCGNPGSTTVVPYQLFSGGVAASAPARLTIKVPATALTSC